MTTMMKSALAMARRLAITAFALFVVLAMANNARADSAADLNSAWEGSLKVVHPVSDAGKVSETFSLRVEIKDQSARVFLKQDDEWTEAKPSAFRVQRLRSNAVITAIDSGRDEDGAWVETWSIAVSQKTNDALLAVYARLVNNENLPPTSDQSFAVAGVGELNRVAR